MGDEIIRAVFQAREVKVFFYEIKPLRRGHADFDQTLFRYFQLFKRFGKIFRRFARKGGTYAYEMTEIARARSASAAVTALDRFIAKRDKQFDEAGNSEQKTFAD